MLSFTSRIKSPAMGAKTNRFSVEKKKTLRPLLAKWIYQSMRPMNIVEDEDFLNTIQQCLSWNGGKRVL